MRFEFGGGLAGRARECSACPGAAGAFAVVRFLGAAPLSLPT
jgi:hypothetical protein